MKSPRALTRLHGDRSGRGVPPDGAPLPDGWPAVKPNEKGVQKFVYAGMVDNVDQNFGRLRAELEAMGEWDNTIVVFTSDNGGPTTTGDGVGARNWPLRGGKHSIWEGGVRATGVIAGKGVGLAGGTEFKHLMHGADWLPTLASTSFFLCCPGAAQPMCHNVIEAMSVGAIPVIEYADRFVPSLQDNVNAICFRGTGRFCDALDRIDQLSAEQVQRIRANVIDYYDRYLRGDQFLRNICNANVAKVSMPFNNKNFFRGAGSTVATRAA
jgi:hypothetical protein